MMRSINSFLDMMSRAPAAVPLACLDVGPSERGRPAVPEALANRRPANASASLPAAARPSCYRLSAQRDLRRGAMTRLNSKRASLRAGQHVVQWLRRVREITLQSTRQCAD